ncbi:ilvB operon leader peptide IvbL [Providencia stuartii]|uniref:IlvB operon leader peptide IvbL n=1 Tax=Providencia stuartii TaxID=588 RepID=A0AAJ1JGL0_PROST|nr:MULTISPECIES: ilvB operon leader peptide IvbL [Providencia]EMA3642610.1 ilvB operon leader peptide IvbL [Providencia stuartii]MBW3100394.1 ilvB operon leader peptide IvbL [Providencia stuartii]MCB5217262.1 ilvB operon leader peptide IvbL [Providencia stuartii]MDE5308446.1 ilvB operon leader peptide IvbL [Providencia stuartii]MDE8751678.1 ilvB operon leader peptide IvbL [Providencia thailandensis]
MNMTLHHSNLLLTAPCAAVVVRVVVVVGLAP